MTDFKNLGITVTNQNCIREEIKSRLNSGNDWYLSFQSPLSSRLFSKNINTRIHKSAIYSLFCMGVKLGLSH
jgi:hypothetical protein